MEVKRGLCFLCWCTCGIQVTIDNGNIVKVEGDPECPFNQGWLCERAQKAIHEIHTHPQRLNYPLKRVGERGQNQWQRISWEQAVDEIAGKIDAIRSQYGPEALMCGGGTGHGSGADTMRIRFMNLFGSPNYFYQGINCGAAMIMGQTAMYGWESISTAVPGLTKAMVLWGYNPANSWMTWWPIFLQAKQEGAKLIVIDPRLTETASYADEWLQIRPGTDGALALSLINVIINEDLYDHDFVENWTIGFEDLKRRAEKYTPERTAEITWIPKEKIIELARIYGTMKPVCHFGHLNWAHLGPTSASAVLYTAALPAITGNLQIPGGTEVGSPMQKIKWYDYIGWDRLINHPQRTRDVVGAGKHYKGVQTMASFMEATKRRYPEGHATPSYMLFAPLRGYWDAILEEKPYPIKAAIFQGTNVFSCLPNTRLIHKALTSPKLELSVTMDLFMTPTAMLSDYVLPATDFFERPEMYNLLGLMPTLHAAPRLVPPLYERHDDYELWRDLGNRLGQAGEWPDTLEGAFSQQLARSNMTFEEFVEKERYFLPEPAPNRHLEPDPATGKPMGFATPSGKIELRSSLLEKLGLDPLPDYEEPLWSPVRTPEMAKEYPLILITGSRLREYQHGEHRHYKAVRKTHPWPTVEIHPETARKLGIADEDWVYVETPLGRVRQRARVTEGIDPRVVHAEAYWWFPEKPGEEPFLFGAFESNINAVLPDDYETLNFGADNYLRALLCKVYRTEDPV